MKISLRWLRDYVDIELAPKELARKLTMAGVEVKDLQATGSTWNNIVVGEVIALNPHPNADRLTLPSVNLGTKQVTVVCGAPNIGLGQKVPFASVGAQIIDGHTGKPISLKAARIRGVLSEGMVCSEKELGISDSHEGIMVLPPEAPIGVPLNEYLGDVILDLDITPNRPDCLSIIGIAREIAALTGQGLHLPQIDYEEADAPIDSFVSVEIIEPSLCPRYCASLITGVRIMPSPAWLQHRLSGYGMRPINNVVDVTNWVMLEYGQPLHAFDYHKLEGKRIVIRRARNGEAMTTLDGLERVLSPDTLVIADRERAVGIAGIMGGLDSEVTDKTSAVLLESANFNQAVIRQGCRSLDLQSEASIHFDKGLNPDLPLVPLKRATQLLLQVTGGKAARGIIDAYPGKSQPQRILLSAKEVKRLSSLEVSIGEITKVLQSLGFECRHTDSPLQISIAAPYWRSDIRCSADLVEEVVRIIGYDKVPTTMLSSPLPKQEPRSSLRLQRSNLKRRLRNILTGYGFQEILTYSLVSLEKLEKLSPKLELRIPPLKVANPMTKEQEYLRTSLRLGLLTTLARNQRTAEGSIRLFEIGKTFLPQLPLTAVSRSPERSEGEVKQSPKARKELPQEKEMLCAILSGTRQELCWQGDGGPLDFFDAKGVVENLLSRLGLAARFEASDDEGLFPGKSADVLISGDKVGVVGDLHPKVAQAFELPSAVSLVEMDMEKLVNKASELRQCQPMPRFPSITRDIALVVDRQVSYQQVKDIIRSFPLAKKVTLFDLYRGKQIPEGKKSFAVRVVYQSPTHTLTDEEVNTPHSRIVNRLHQELGADLRD